MKVNVTSPVVGNSFFPIIELEVVIIVMLQSARK